MPFSLQLTVVLLAGQLLKPTTAFLALFTYLLAGLVGLPVFTGGGGLGYLLQPSFGYIPGFVAAAVAVSFLVNNIQKRVAARIFANCCGTVLVYLFGLSYYFLLNTVYFGKVLEISKILLTCWAFFIPSDLIAIVLTAFLGQRLCRFMPK